VLTMLGFALGFALLTAATSWRAGERAGMATGDDGARPRRLTNR
jgi:hypothetical protein